MTNRKRWIAMVLAAGFASLVFAACGSDSDSTESEAEIEARIEAERKDAAQQARQQARIRELEKEVDDLSDSGGASVPTGGGWSTGVETQVNPGLHRTTFAGPGGAVLLVDSTPSERPRYDGAAQRTTVSHPAYGSMERLVFRGEHDRDALRDLVVHRLPDPGRLGWLRGSRRRPGELRRARLDRRDGRDEPALRVAGHRSRLA